MKRRIDSVVRSCLPTRQNAEDFRHTRPLPRDEERPLVAAVDRQMFAARTFRQYTLRQYYRTKDSMRALNAVPTLYVIHAYWDLLAVVSSGRQIFGRRSER